MDNVGHTSTVCRGLESSRQTSRTWVKTGVLRIPQKSRKTSKVRVQTVSSSNWLPRPLLSETGLSPEVPPDFGCPRVTTGQSATEVEGAVTVGSHSCGLKGIFTFLRLSTGGREGWSDPQVCKSTVTLGESEVHFESKKNPLKLSNLY